MPSLFQIKTYRPSSYYHVYNRGAQRTEIYKDKNDYWVLRRIARNLQKQAHVRIDTFCLLPTHFHFLLFQQEERDLVAFMRSLGIRYVLYFNRKYKRSGRLFEERYKAILQETESDIERTRQYILDNPINQGYLNWPHVGRDI